MGSWFVRPETVRLSLSEGHWLIVKKRLNSGEQRAAFARMYLIGADGKYKVNLTERDIAHITAFLLDWSLTDDEGKPVAIRDLSADALTAVLDNLEPDRFTEIKNAIQNHDAAMVAEREKEKNGQGGEKNAPAISPLPSALAGASSGSVN